MGVLFNVAKINTTTGTDNTVLSNIEIDSSAAQPTPIMAITKLTREGVAQKVAEAAIENNTYNTVWVPIGQDGWKINIQANLFYREKVSPVTDEIAAWLKIDTGQLLYVASNCCNNQGAISSSHKVIDKLPVGSLWYIDKLTISSHTGISVMADMEMVLYRCWEVVSNVE